VRKDGIFDADLFFYHEITEGNEEFFDAPVKDAGEIGVMDAGYLLTCFKQVP
jgi:hypothetical protein